MFWNKNKTKKINKERRTFTQTQKTHLWYKQDWICNMCSDCLDLRTVRYDHIIRYSEWWKTDISNWQALCSNCHSRKTFEENLSIINTKN